MSSSKVALPRHSPPSRRVVCVQAELDDFAPSVFQPPVQRRLRLRIPITTRIRRRQRRAVAGWRVDRERRRRRPMLRSPDPPRAQMTPRQRRRRRFLRTRRSSGPLPLQWRGLQPPVCDVDRTTEGRTGGAAGGHSSRSSRDAPRPRALDCRREEALRPDGGGAALGRVYLATKNGARGRVKVQRKDKALIPRETYWISLSAPRANRPRTTTQAIVNFRSCNKTPQAPEAGPDSRLPDAPLQWR